MILDMYENFDTVLSSRHPFYIFVYSFNQQALEPENQHYYTTEIDSRGTINRPRAVNPAAAPSQQMQRSGGFDSDDESEFESTKSSMKEEEYEGSVDTGDGIAKPKLGR